MHDFIGQTIKGYEIRQQLGAGGFGAVFRAYQAAVEREVAIKVILPEHASHPDFIRNFEAEAQLVARLEHPHIVPLFDYWRDPEGAYLVMRLLRGGSLRDRLKQGKLAPGDAVRIIEQVAAALATAHLAGVIHRDIKPDNILMDESGNAYLSDFGIAKRITEATDRTEGITGSITHMAPEQLQYMALSPQTDIYSLGIVIYQMVTGQHPFPDLSISQMIQKHLYEPLPEVTQPELDAVIKQATMKTPAERYPDTLALAAAFRRALQGEHLAPASSSVDLSIVANPYKGLRAFDEADALDFFGREALVERLLNHMKKARFLAVVGPSGSGKSSVVKAGVIPMLRKGRRC
jgi:serine/threonine protein kinase